MVVEDKSMGLRARTRDAVRADIAAQALILFDEKGFETTTVEDVVAAVGISARSFYRYFPVKEDVVTGDPLPFGLKIRDALLSRPQDEPPWTSLRECFAPVVEESRQNVVQNLRVMRVVASAPSLRSRNYEKHLVWAGMLEPIVIGRLQLHDEFVETADLRGRCLVHSAFACFDVAMAEWTRREGSAPLDTLLDETFAFLAP